MGIKKSNVTIVTVCYNAEKTIENTLISVLEQNYQSMEYIIVDGKSKDKTMDIVKRYEPMFGHKNISFCCLSEKDNGIYDAMNKGTNLAQGEWIIFMNSGDTFYCDCTIKNVFMNQIDPDVKCVYGDMQRMMDCGNFVDKARPLEHLEQGMVFSHQSAFIRTSEMKQYPYNLEYCLAADFNFFHKLYKRGMKFQYIPEIISRGLDGGVSSLNRKQVNIEYARILGIETNIIFIVKFYSKQIRRNLKNILHSLFPKELVLKVRSWNYERRSRLKK